MVNEEIGFSLWLDFIERDYLQKSFKRLIDDSVINGATSNPAIFASSIEMSPAYTSQLDELQNHSPKAKYEALAKTDIEMAAAALKPLYEKGRDGFVSIEVDPFLCDDTEGTVDEGRRLYREIGMENVMIKVPATEAGYGAMKRLMSEGIHVNATLIFSPMQALRCLDAMAEGLKIWRATGNEKDVQGVLSVFVSRFDRMLDEELEEKGLQPGYVGIMNAAKIYNIVETHGDKAIRTLFASTGVKGDAYPADYYIKELMAPHSVNTAPLATIEAFLEAPEHHPKLPIEEAKIESFFEAVNRAGIDMQKVYETLLRDGLASFKEAFANLLANLE
ncbi:transaldolase [Hydrogenimonas cancrithermarum]|uniref:Transaldolase n=1 Tax=Hydrogenimonas cancrithermarum TaxID=2993563 RepID=A0ABN6WTZ5_9BACT|nr:transaldolase [Hydrogenimonas cancrithermarum]BDY12590.1 transaldolase [Hydrogenimonas cancrithermarum]